MSGAPVRVLVYATAPAGEPAAVVDAYHQISTGLMGIPGLLGNELLHSIHDPAGYAVASYWADLDAFRSWEVTPGHPLATAPLRPFQTPGRSAGIYQVAGAYPIPSLPSA